MFKREDGRVTGSLVVDDVAKKDKVPPWVGGVVVEEPAQGGQLAAQIAEEREAQREGDIPVPAPSPEPFEREGEKSAPSKSSGAASVKTSDTTGVAKGASASKGR